MIIRGVSPCSIPYRLIGMLLQNHLCIIITNIIFILFVGRTSGQAIKSRQQTARLFLKNRHQRELPCCRFVPCNLSFQARKKGGRSATDPVLALNCNGDVFIRNTSCLATLRYPSQSTLAWTNISFDASRSNNCTFWDILLDKCGCAVP